MIDCFRGEREFPDCVKTRQHAPIFRLLSTHALCNSVHANLTMNESKTSLSPNLRQFHRGKRCETLHIINFFSQKYFSCCEGYAGRDGGGSSGCVLDLSRHPSYALLLRNKLLRSDFPANESCPGVSHRTFSRYCLVFIF